MLLSIIIPVYNEARTVRALLERVRAVPLPLDRELIVIDDYSKDGTREILTNEHGITLLLHEKNRGKGAALQTGIRAARGDIVLIQDADLEYDPNDYEKIIGPLLRGEADVVYGSRFLEARNRYRLHTYLANKFLSLLTRLIVPLPVTDMETCYKAFRTPLIKGLDLTEERFGIEPEMTIKMAFVPGVRYREVPISYHGRTIAEGKKLIGLTDGIGALWCLAKHRVRMLELWPRVACVLFAGALIVRLALLFIFLPYDPTFVMDGDSIGYLSLAENLEVGNGFSSQVAPPYEPDSFRTPGYPLFLAFHHTLFGSYVTVLLSQLILTFIIALIIVRLGARYVSEKAGVIAAGIFLFMPFSLLVSMRYLTQVFFTTVLMLAVWFFLSYLKNRTDRHLILTAFLLPIAVLIRPIAIAIVAPFIASGALAVWWGQLSMKRLLAASLVLVICFSAVLSPWLIRNHAVFGTYALSSLMPFQLYYYDGPSIYATAHDISFQEAWDVLDERMKGLVGFSHKEEPERFANFSTITPILWEAGFTNAFEDPRALIETRVAQFFKFFVRDGIRYWIERDEIPLLSGWGFGVVVIERLVLAALALGFFAALIFASRGRNLPQILMVLVVLYFALLTGVMASAGLRYPAEPLFLLLGVAGLFEVYKKVRLPLP